MAEKKGLEPVVDVELLAANPELYEDQRGANPATVELIRAAQRQMLDRNTSSQQ